VAQRFEDRSVERVDAAVWEAAFRDHPFALCLVRSNDLRVAAANPRFVRETGRRLDEVIGRTFQEIGLVTPDHFARLRAELDTADDEIATTLPYIRPDGGVVGTEAVFRRIELEAVPHLLAVFSRAPAPISQQEVIDRKDAILEAAGFAAQMFLRVDRWEEAIDEVLGRLGRAADVSRAHVFENVDLPEGLASTHRFEWCAPGIQPQIDNPDTIDQPFDADQDEWMGALREGRPWAVNVATLSQGARDEFSAQGIVSILDMPVFAGRAWWGSIGFDDCVRERQWSQVEIEALRVVANTLGAAIDRQRTERDLRETEGLYRTLIEQIPASVYINRTSVDYEPLYASPGIESMLGVSAEDYMTSKLWVSMIHPDDQQRVLAEDARTDRTMEPFSVEYRMRHADGRIVWVRDEAEVVRDEHGEPRFWSGVMFDITSLKRAEEDLGRALALERQASAQLRALDAMKNTFLEAVSHDLRTPLSAVLGSALTLEREDITLTPEDQLDLVRRIASNARKLQRLVNDLLDLDRLSRGLLEPTRTKADLAEVVRTVVAESDALAGREVAFDVEPTPINIDVPKVERIIENLLVNAVRHTPPQARVWVRVAPGSEGGVLVVEDDGPGIPQEDRARIFAAFERGETSAHAPGSGIGLTLVARFAELHGGRAWVEEREGGGASFMVWFPGVPAGTPGGRDHPDR
jgi:PAS domain S-box-containing protein